MGIFSFLSRDKGGQVETAESTGASAPQGAPAPQAAPSPQDTWTAGFDTSALTAPAPEPAGDNPQVGPTDPAKTAELQGPIIEVLKTVYDPEIPVDIYELGLIYEILVDADNRVLVKMTLTSPACPSAQQIPSEVRYKVKTVPGVTDAWVEIVWEPPWDKDRMSEAAKLSLGFF
jgi:FeS assembly SUF system protein